ncbi:MAG: hypothetical protein A2W03_07035 [Candidatus Aminicenantes bacterium RBG_16_63_16]|nr:MAG: hypothetical protein A2W03_07035 [Candidatus Aminicenantes bacterium RBG_16_63_16]
MKRTLSFPIGLFLAAMALLGTGAGPFAPAADVTGAAVQTTAPPITITVLYDNYPSREGLKTDRGFSCLIRGTEKTVLFDTGARSEILFHNFAALKIDPQDADLVVISHTHGDHTGGRSRFFDVF